MAIDLSRALAVLRSQLGYREGPRNNEQKYSPNVPTLEWSNFQPWCATFTCWVFLQAGGTAGTDFPVTASCLQQVAWGRSRGRFYSSPRVGDLAMIGPGGGTHVEVVVRVSGSTFWSIGGNTSGSWGGNYANGDGVYEKSRSVSSAYGFVRPVYGSSAGGSPAGEDDMPDFTEYTAGAGQAFPAGEWTTLRFTSKDGKSGSYYSVAFEDTRVSLTAFATIDSTSVSKGDEVQMRANLFKESGGIDAPSGVYRKGASGAVVKRIQKAFQKAGANLGTWGVDGDYGDATVTACRWVQRKYKLADDGIYGPDTRDALRGAFPTSWTISRSFPIAQDVQSGGGLHLSYALNCDVPAGHRLRVRVAGHGGKPVKVNAARAYVQSWAR